MAQIRYTTNGSDPTITNGTVYNGPFSLTTTTTVKYRAWDFAGNASATKTQLISLDALAPTVSVTAPANGTTVSGNVKISAGATDTGGSGIQSVSFYVDGNLRTVDTSSPYTDTWNTKTVAKGQHTLSAVALDKAGNTTTSAAITVTVS